MRKNNKGFTLIEIIAVVAILGIISVVVVPNIFSLVTQSRDEIYLQDARRLIAQAQYKMSSNSSNIEKPSNGECIVMSLNYLNINDFQSPPHGGAYMSDASFVVIKSDGGTYKYAAMLVEHTSDGIYRGVKLSTEEDLNSKTAHKSITSFNSGEIRYVDSQTALAAGATEASQVDTAYIGRYLKDYGTNQQWLPTDGEYIIGRYNYEKEVEHGAKDTSIPKINPKVISSDSKNPESLLVNLTVSASDADSPISSLQVCSFVSRNKDLSFPEMDSAYCEPYGTSGNYSKSYDLSKAENGEFSYKEQAIAYVYVAVYDPEKNSDKKKIEYFIRENEPPTIKSFNVIPADDNGYRLPNVKLSAEVSDDMDNVSDLQVCLQQDKDSDECNSYIPYSSFFNNGVHNYNFVDEKGNNLGLDGSEHTLKLFVKDSLGKVSSSKVSYEIYKNQAPIFTRIKMIPNKLDYKNLYSVNFDIDTADDISNIYNLKIRICDDRMNEEKDCKFMSMSDYNNRERDGLYAFEFSNQEYDGKDRTVTVTLEDEHGLSTSETLTLTNVYKNKAPSIVINSITGTEFICSNCDTSKGGSYNTKVNFSIIDDLISERDFVSRGFKVCISENKSDCSEDKINTKNFKLYFGNEGTYEFKKPESNIYGNNLNKKLYVAVVDDHNSLGIKEGDYSIYQNRAPEITGSFDIVTTEKHNYCEGEYVLDENDNYVCNGSITPYSFNIPKVKIDTTNLKIIDDFNDMTGEVCYYIGSDSSKEKCVKTNGTDIYSFLSDISIEFTFLDNNGKEIKNYDGQKINVRLKAIDDYGASSYSDYMSYTLYKDEKPVIKKFKMGTSIISDNPDDVYNSNLVSYEFSVLDFNDTYSVCITENDSCSDSEFVKSSSGSGFDGSFIGSDTLTSFHLYYDGEKHNWKKDYKYTNESDTLKHFNFFVKDSHGNVTKYKDNLNYNVYTACSDETKVKKERTPLYDFSNNFIYDGDGNQLFEDDLEIEPVNPNSVISAEACQGKCYHKYKIDDSGNERFNQYNVQYARPIYYEDKKSKTLCDKEYENLDKYCNHTLCFMLDNSDYTSITYVGLDYVRPDELVGDSKYDEILDLGYWTWTSSKFKEYAIGERCTNAINNGSLLFSSKDTRCSRNVEVCDNEEDHTNCSSLKYCDYQGIINCQAEKDEFDNAEETCNRPELYDVPTPCADDDENCIAADKRTCNEGENPSDTERGCTRMCGSKIVLDKDEDGNDIEGTEHSAPEEPSIDNCTYNPPLSEKQKKDIYNNCFNPISESYISCSNKYVSKCNKNLFDTNSGFCSFNTEDSSWQETSCDNIDNISSSGGTTMTRFCEKNFIDGRCYKDSDKCSNICKSGDSEEECNLNLDKAGCKKTCYEKIDCTNKARDKVFHCTGFYKTYRASYNDSQLKLQYTGTPICPEAYNYVDPDTGKTGKNEDFPFKNSETGMISYIEFSQSEQLVEESN